jgi:hypothetical protein
MPITGGGGNVVDWGLLTALQGVDDWQQKRLDRNAELKQAKQLRDLAEQQRQQQQEAGDKVFNIYNEVAKLKVLPPDTEKIRVKNDELINPIINGIKKYGGDVNLYLQSGGYNDLVKYNQDLQGSNEVVSALRRAKDYADYNNDIKSGKIIRPIYKDVNGSRQKLNPQDEISGFLDNKKDDFEYRGGFDPFVADYRENFSKVYANKDRKYRTATKDDVFTMAMFEAKKKGLSKEDAEYYSEIVANEYQNGIDNGNLTPYAYKFDNQLDNAVKQSTIDRNRASANASNARANKINSGGGDDDPTLFWINKVVAGGEDTKFAIGELINTATGDGKVTSAEVIEEAPTRQAARGMQTLNKPATKIKVEIAVTGGGAPRTKIFDLNNADDVAELSTMQSAKVNSKTFANRYYEYQKSKGGANQSNANQGVEDVEYEEYLKSIGL